MQIRFKSIHISTVATDVVSSLASFSEISLFLAVLITLVFSQSIAAEEKVVFKPDYSGGQAFSENIKTCTPGTFVLFNPVCMNIIKASVDMANQYQPKVKETKILTQEEVDQGILGCKALYQIIGKEGNKCQYQIVDMIAKTKSNCTISVDELSSLAENSKKIYSGETSVDASTAVLPIGTQQCTAMPFPQ